MRRTPCTVREMSEVERAYVGGMIDGEGWFTVPKTRGYPAPSIGLGNTDLEIISAILRATGVGGVHFARWARYGKKALWVWQVQARANVHRIAEQCYLYSSKCQQWIDSDEALKLGAVA